MSGKLRIAPFLILLCLLAVSLIVWAPIEEEADGWTDRYFYSSYSSSPQRNAYTYFSGSNYLRFSSTISYVGSTSSSDYRSYFSYDLSYLDDDVNLDSIYLRMYYGNHFESQNVYFYLLTFDPTTSDPETIHTSIPNGVLMGTQYVSSTPAYLGFYVDSAAVEHIEDLISSGQDRIYIGVRGSGTTNYLYFYPTSSSSYLRFHYDQSAPNTPILPSLPTYQTATPITFSYLAIADNPSGGSTGGVEYQIGLFPTSGTNDMIRATEWTTSTTQTITELQDGQQYYFRIRARDARGYTSGWSSYRYTMVDLTPPTQPVFHNIPEYTNGTTIDISWAGSSDTGSGVYNYVLQSATETDFSDYTGYTIAYPGNSQTVSMTSGTKYYFQVHAMDWATHASTFSQVGFTTSDADPPTVPVMMKEPPFTKGDTNTFSWHPSVDEGVGVHHYEVQVSAAEDFRPSMIEYDIDTDQTYATIDDLDDATKHYMRVRAVDEFHHESAWSEVEWSIQDHKGPGELGLTPLMEYLPRGPISLQWEGAEDNGSGVDHYEVKWSTDPDFLTDVYTNDDVIGQSFQIQDLAPDTTWYIKVRSYDDLGNPGDAEITYTTIDATPPTQPVIDPMDDFTGGRTTTVSWSESTDVLSGFYHYKLNVYTSPDRVGLAFTVHTTETSFEVPGLSDGTTYYYEVVAYDRAGNEIYSTLVHSTQDTTGPSTPSLVPMNEYSTDPLPRVEWGPATDESGGDVEYQVQWSNSVLFTGNTHESPWLTGTNYQIYDTEAGTRAEPAKEPLEDGTYYIRVRSRDHFGQNSAFGNAMRLTIDTTAPEVPLIGELPDYSGGTTVKVSWQEIIDSPGMEVGYKVLVYENETGDPIMESSWTSGSSVDISDLVAHNTYYFRVVARDHLGQVSDPSEATMTIIDVDGPMITMPNNGIFGKSDLYLNGDVSDGGCGVDIVELSFNGGQSWSECTFASGKWSFAKTSLPTKTTEVLVRGLDAGGNIGTPVRAYIDNDAPTIFISYPLEDTTITGPTQLTGNIMDAHLETYSISYLKAGSLDWADIVPTQSSSQFSGILGIWDPHGLSGGLYQIKVTAMDALGQTTERIVNVTVAGANLNIDPAQISFSNTHPLPGDTVEIKVTVSNFGDSPAEDVTVTIYDGADVIHTQTGVDIPANGLIVITTDLKVSGSHDITARATSDLYDSGEMTSPSVLEPAEEEMVLENFGGIFGLLALILAIVALILVFVFKGKKEKEPKEKKEENRDEEKVEEKKEEVPRAPPMEMGKKEEPKVSLPPSHAADKPELPSPPIAPRPALPSPTATPPIPPTPPAGTAPPAEHPQETAPMLKAAPPVTTPVQPAQTITTPQANEGEKAPEVQLPNL